MLRRSKNEETIFHPWKRDKHGKGINREPTSSCCLCTGVIYDSVEIKKLVICATCVQALMGLDAISRERVRDKLRARLDE